MCRLLFLKNNQTDPNFPLSISNIIKKFRDQSDTYKFTPFLDQEIDAHFHKDGIGFAWFINNNWVWEKSTDMSFEFQIPLDSVYVIGHLRNKGNCTGTIKYENTHPFVHNSFIFCHNGKINDFTNHRETIIGYIDKKYNCYIKGETDSEYIFYLILTLYDKINNMMDAISEFQSLMIHNKIIFYGNFIIANDKNIWITRLSNNEGKSCSLYHDKKNMIISSEPISQLYKLIPCQTIMEIII